jgi:hypothetical protein
MRGSFVYRRNHVACCKFALTPALSRRERESEKTSDSEPLSLWERGWGEGELAACDTVAALTHRFRKSRS